MPSEYYKLDVPTMAAARAPQQLVTIPAETVLSVDSDDMRVGGRVVVKWGSNVATMFAVDLLTRAHKITPNQSESAVENA
jgi:hypothetical protein